MRELTVVAYELHQVLAGLEDGFQSFLLFSACRRQQGLAPRDDRRERIHNLMSKHADEPHPGINLLIGELVVDVADGDDVHILPVESRMRLVHGEVLELILHLVDVGDDVTVQKP